MNWSLICIQKIIVHRLFFLSDYNIHYIFLIHEVSYPCLVFVISLFARSLLNLLLFSFITVCCAFTFYYNFRVIEHDNFVRIDRVHYKPYTTSPIVT